MGSFAINAVEQQQYCLLTMKSRWPSKSTSYLPHWGTSVEVKHPDKTFHVRLSYLMPEKIQQPNAVLHEEFERIQHRAPEHNLRLAIWRNHCRMRVHFHPSPTEPYWLPYERKLQAQHIQQKVKIIYLFRW